MALNEDFIISFVRHAQSRGNVGIPYEHEYHKEDPPLSPKGLLQAKKLSESSILADVDKIFSSTLVRAIETAYPTAERLSKEIVLLPDLMEINTEIGGTEDFRIQRDFPLAVPCLSEPTPTGGPLLLGAEGDRERQLRAERCLKHFLSLSAECSHIMVVTHGSYFGYLMRAALGISLPETFCWQVDNCSVTRVIYRKEGVPKLSFSNYTGHLD